MACLASGPDHTNGSLEFGSGTLGKGDCPSRLMAVKPAWRLNARRSFSMTNGIRRQIDAIFLSEMDPSMMSCVSSCLIAEREAALTACSVNSSAMRFGES